MNTSCTVYLTTLARFVAAAFLLSTATRSIFADVVTDWNATYEAAVRNPTPSAPVLARSAAIVHVAIFDAVNGIAKKYTPVRVTDTAPAGARAEAAAAQAAYTTLLSLFPSKQSLLDAQLAASLAQLTSSGATSQSITIGRAWGETVAQQILAWRATDGFSQVLTYPGSTASGYWRHAPLGSAPAGGLSLSVTTPFALTNLAAFDPGPPYGFADRATAMATAAYAADVNEVKARGGMVSSVRTQAQTDLAMFIHIADSADINAIIRRVIPANAQLVDNARTFALINIAGMDAFIVCFQAKYKYGLWRPLQAINYADLDGNAATVADPTWAPIAATPSHPEYLSGHGSVSGGMLGMAAALLGDATSFTLSTSNAGAPAITPTFSRFSAYCEAITEARINAGFHFRTACTLAQASGFAVADQIVKNALLPLPGHGFANLSVRGSVRRDQETLIAGLVISSGSRQVLVRGVGPGLQTFGVSSPVADPSIAVYDSNGTLIAQNDNWASGNATMTAALTAATNKVGAFSLGANSFDAALLTTLGPGAYTIHVNAPAGTSGVALIEAYEVP
ncbi:MAG TPA: vanadium-dependent haloperoxidase [Opitutaceae bacterium]|nr:vanadium-dependent haloperoxidase [Opitutaceae bacterium]